MATVQHSLPIGLVGCCATPNQILIQRNSPCMILNFVPSVSEFATLLITTKYRKLIISKLLKPFDYNNLLTFT
ncbi:unnamed protein product [Hymenolepis diminuta]|uniref:Uncharacterized protein n=1 Tax=Hymenolepis diminuta TaxID=6216 RepID=A0A3P6ZDZ4_HYMDI|nr:unnamed protein product [Hymenolepis diminuta]